MKGSRHRAAESKLKERELAIQDERNKRIALSGRCSSASSAHKPLIQQARKAASEILNRRSPQGSTIQETQVIRAYNTAETSESLFTQGKGTPEVGAVSTVIAGQEEFNLRERRERELKFTAAGWKRDCHGRWFKDENVRFYCHVIASGVYLPVLPVTLLGLSLLFFAGFCYY